jgi:very-long-chain (3R)-3-hydroxyacyl-CoA dehydratase
VLYPLGVYGEMRVLWDSLGRVDQVGLFAVKLPNTWNFAFSIGMYIRFLLVVLYVPLFVNQYMHMIRLRRGVLDVDRSK